MTDITYTVGFKGAPRTDVRNAKGALTEKISDYTFKLQDEFDTIAGVVEDLSDEIIAVAGSVPEYEVAVRIGLPMAETLEGSGISLKGMANYTLYGQIFAPADIEITGGYLYICNTYAKDTTDASVKIYRDTIVGDGSYDVVASAELPAGGLAVKSTVPFVLMEESILEGDRIDVKVNVTGDAGSGSAIVVLKYKVL